MRAHRPGVGGHGDESCVSRAGRMRDDASMLITTASTLDRLVTLTAPGAPVAPVVAALGEVETQVRDALPALEASRGGGGLVDQLDRIRNSAGMLRQSLAELQAVDGMANFDAAFAADDASWDAWFTRSAQLVRDAAASIQPEATRA